MGSPRFNLQHPGVKRAACCRCGMHLWLPLPVTTRIHVPRSQELWSCPGATRWRPGCAPCCTVSGATSWPTCSSGSPSLTTSATAPVSCWPLQCGRHLEAPERLSLGPGGTPTPGRREVEGARTPVAICRAPASSLPSPGSPAQLLVPLTLGLLSSKVLDFLLSLGPLLQVRLLLACEAHLCGYEGGGEGAEDCRGHPSRTPPLPPRVVHHDRHRVGQR